MANGLFSKFKNWMTEEDDYYEEDDEIEAELDEIEEEPMGNDISAIKSSAKTTATSKVVNLHGVNQMKVVIVEPKKYEDVTVIADHLKQKKAVIVNLEGLAQDVDTRKAIFYFMSGAVYVVEGTIQKVSKAIFILAPNNVDIDANMKKELESKAFFPWQK
ncbi:MAG: cell division protein SepF [Intestinibacter sp.]|uniref:cell division protein SepF n=1 Tax=Intestinibacter sp. TaxID=1965304 RepID=UPI003F17DD56